MLSVHVLVFQRPKLFKEVFFPFRLIVFQPLLHAVLLHSVSCNTHKLGAVADALRELSIGLCTGNYVLCKRSLRA